MGRGSNPGHVLHRFLLALYTNLAADVAKLGVLLRAPGGGGHPRDGSKNPRKSRYRPQLFLSQLEVGLAKFEIWDRKYTS